MITTMHKGKYYNVEYSIVNVSELEGELRIDAEYYNPAHIQILLKLKQKKGIYLSKNKFFIKRGIQPRYSNNQTEYLVLNSVHILDGGIDFANTKFINEEFYFKKIQSSFKYKDILVNSTGVGTLGRIAYVYKKNKRGIVDNHITRIRVKEKELQILPEYLLSFLRSKYGQSQIERLFHGTSGQIEIYPSDFANFFLPVPSNILQQSIEKVVLKAYEEKQKAEQLYEQAEKILLEELGLKNWKPKTKKIKINGEELEEEENISVRNLSEVIKADRMDAEYWEPKYDEIEKLIKNYKKGYSIVSKEFLHKANILKINKDDYYNYVEISSINTSMGDFTPSYLQGKDLPANAKLKLDINDLIVSKVRTYRKGIALIHKIYPNLIGSSAFVALHERKEPKVNIETLFVYLRTDIFSLWSYKFYTGTSYPTLMDNDILNLPTPLIDSQVQQKISQLIQQSFKARESGKEFLEIAKRAVEIYIEEDEEEGLKYIKNKLKKSNNET